MKHVAHWDDAPSWPLELGEISSTWTGLGQAASSDTIGLRRLEVHPDSRSTPVHDHLGDEEIFYVLGGSGLLWLNGATCEIGANDCIVYRAGDGAHALRAGPDGLDVLTFGMRVRVAATHLPRAGVAWLFPTWIEAGVGSDPFTREKEAGPLEYPPPSPRPKSVVGLADVEAERLEHGRVARTRRKLSEKARSRQSGLQHVTVEPGRWGTPPHCHSAEEELFFVLDGDGVVALGDEEHPVRRGSVVSRPAGTGVAHAFRAGDAGLVYLAYGTREPNDICWYPRSRKVALRGLGVIFRVSEPLDYWDGED
ncbi:MAG TPA: cupin domain-containing protein [Solirubrobacteraceae bacterium]|nr:cupin domain-containing protein [Solirubrobacteraceae bacterium]